MNGSASSFTSEGACTSPRGYEPNLRRRHGKDNRHRDSAVSMNSSASDSYSLFQGTKRREKIASSEGHIEMIKACRYLLAALVFSGDGMNGLGEGRGGRRTDAWINANDKYVENLVYQVWDEVRNHRKKYRISANLRIEREPFSTEAREVCRSQDLQYILLLTNSSS